MKKCHIIKNYIQEYFDNNINEVSKQKLFNHIKKCKNCEQEFKYYIKIIDSLKTLKEFPLPEGFKERLHNKLTYISYQQDFFKYFLRKLVSYWVLSFSIILIISIFIIKNFSPSKYNNINFYSSQHPYVSELSTYRGNNFIHLYENGILRIKLKTNKEIKM